MRIKDQAEFYRTAFERKERKLENALHNLRNMKSINADLLAACEDCDKAFVSWQLGQIPGRPEDILALINKVRAAIAAARGCSFQSRRGSNRF